MRIEYQRHSILLQQALQRFIIQQGCVILPKITLQEIVLVEPYSPCWHQQDLLVIDLHVMQAVKPSEARIASHLFGEMERI